MKTLVAFLFLGSLGLAWCNPGAFNIARTGEASQSSDYYGGTSVSYAYKAIDSVKDTNWLNGFCTHTNNDLPPWWRLDMKHKYKVKIVILSGRSDGAMQRLMDAEVRIGNSPDNNNPVCGKVTQITDPTTTFSCYGMEGRYVSVVIPVRAEFLSICELEVYGDPVSDVTYY
ncbi:pentraxin fusion protein-like [Rana temporaria]|uniref:pentraxin fusion protein-like n=1 Tax=Rana temporaria TaxID=8407 RepID=UPI001AAC9B44|nr:pentraxin fusion protein-like [Rana temporaria]